MKPNPAPAIAGMIRRTTRLPGDVRGAAIIEFALVAVPFLGVIFAALATALTFFAQQNLETAAAASGRTLMVGSAQTGALSKAQFKAQACANLPVFMRCSNLLVSVDRSTDFASAALAAPAVTLASDGTPSATTPYNVGLPGDIVTLRLYYVWQLPSVNLGFDITSLPGGKRLLIATAVAKTEQYS